jgi:hypothetical protein
MENELTWRSKVEHDSERDVVLRGGPAGFIGGGDVTEHKLSDKLAREAEIERRTKIASSVIALRRCQTKAECASVLAPLYELGLIARERVPLIRALRTQGFTQDEIIKALWQVGEGPSYEEARAECEKVAVKRPGAYA